MKHWKKGLLIFLKVIFKITEVSFALIIVAGGLALGRLYIDPVEVKDFLPTLEKRLLPEGIGLKLDAKSVTLHASFEDNGILHIAIKDLAIIREDGAVALRLPEVDMAYRWRNIFRLNYMPNDLGIRGAFLQLLIDPDGNFHLYTDGKTVPAKVIKQKETGLVLKKNALSATDKLLQTFRSFDRITLEQASLVIDDRQKDQKLSLPSVNLAIERQPERKHALQLSAVANINQDLTNINVEAQLDRANRIMGFEIEWDRFDLRNLARFIPELKDIQLSINGRLKGILDFAPDCQNILSCFKEGTFTFKVIEPGTINLPDPLSNLYHIQSAVINGAISEHFSQVKIAKSSLNLKNGPTASLSVDITGADQCLSAGLTDDLSIVLKSHISSLPITQVPSVWPKETGPDAHAWVKENLTDGTVESADFTLYFKGAELVDLYGEIPVKNVKVRYLDEMSPVQNMNGLVKLYPNRVLITGTSGNIGQLKLSAATIDLTEVQSDVPHAEIALDVAGPVREALELISEKPLEFPQMFELDVSKTGGQSKIHTALSFPISDDLEAKDVHVALEADIQDGQFPTLFEDYPLTDSKLHLTVNNTQLVLNGTGSLNGLPLTLKWTELFNAVKPGDIHAKYDISLTTKTDQIKPFISNIEDFVSGTVSIKGNINETVSGNLSGEADWDASKALVHVYPLSYTKDPDVALTAKTAFKYVNDTLSFDYTIKGITDLETLDPVFASGTVKLGKSFELILKEVTAPKTDMKGSLVWDQNNALKIDLKGKSWSAGGLYDWPTSDQPEPMIIPKDISVDIELDQLILTKDKPIDNLVIHGVKENNLWQKLSLDMKTEETVHLSFSPDSQKLSLTINNFADFLSRLNVTDKMDKGEFRLRARQQKEGGFKGIAVVEKLSLKDTGFLFQAATILGIFDAIRGQNLVFDEGQAPFTVHPTDNLTISFEEAYLSGTNLGITFEGSVSTNSVHLTGSVIPAYAINSLPGKIPLIGGLFRDGDGGGLIGVRYDVKGPPTNPDISFDPLKSIAPGILGKLFK